MSVSSDCLIDLSVICHFDLHSAIFSSQFTINRFYYNIDIHIHIYMWTQISRGKDRALPTLAGRGVQGNITLAGQPKATLAGQGATTHYQKLVHPAVSEQKSL